MRGKPDGWWSVVQKQSGIVFKVECLYLVRQVNPNERRKTSGAGLPVSLHTALQGNTNYKPTETHTHLFCCTAKSRTTSGLCFKIKQCGAGSVLTDMLVPFWHTFISSLHCIHRNVKILWDLTLTISMCGQLTHELTVVEHCIKHTLVASYESRPHIHWTCYIFNMHITRLSPISIKTSPNFK